MKTVKAKIREDLQEYIFLTDSGILIDNNKWYVSSYRGEEMGIYIDGEWHKANSIDFEFK